MVKKPKNHKAKIQKLLNRQARAITGMYPSIPVYPSLSEASLIPAKMLLDYRQKAYAYQLLTLPDYYPTKQVLPISLRKGDESSQPGKQPKDTLMWVENAKPWLFGHCLGHQIASNYSIDPEDGVEPVESLRPTGDFSRNIVIEEKNKVLEKAKKYWLGSVMWTNRSKLGKENVGAAISWKDKNLNVWKGTSVFLGTNKKILDAEL